MGVLLNIASGLYITEVDQTSQENLDISVYRDDLVNFQHRKLEIIIHI